MHIAPTNRSLPCLQNQPQIQRRHGGARHLSSWSPGLLGVRVSFLLCVFYPRAGTETVSRRLSRKVDKRLWKVLIAEPHPGAAWATPEGIHRGHTEIRACRVSQEPPGSVSVPTGPAY